MVRSSPINYALLAGGDFVSSILLFFLSFYAGRTQRVTRILLSASFALHGLSMTLLSIVTGESAIRDIESLRPYIYLVRHLETLSVVLLVFSLLALVVIALRSGRVGSDV